MPVRQTLQEGLKPYLPENSLDLVLDWIGNRPIHLKVTRGRTSKLGDFRPPVKDRINKITVNGNLNPYEFLITLTHELAHMVVWEKFGRKVSPHGTAWKSHYAGMLSQLLERRIFPPEIRQIIVKQVMNPKATSKCDTLLVRALQPHNEKQHGIFLEDLPTDSIFRMENGRKFRKKEKLRKWYRCISLDNGKNYRISPVARVIPEHD